MGKTARSVLTGDSAPDVSAKVDADVAEAHRKGLIRETVKLAKKDEAFRRRLLDDLLALGQGKRGTKAREWEQRMLVASYDAVREFIQADTGEEPTQLAVAEKLTLGPYAGMDPESLLRRLRRYRKA